MERIARSDQRRNRAVRLLILLALDGQIRLQITGRRPRWNCRRQQHQNQ